MPVTPDNQLPYPRKVDGIATRAQALFLYSSAAGLAAVVFWAAFTELDKVTRSEGRVVAQSQNQLVQHLEGGIITEILVKEGQLVSRGEPLLRIEDSFAKAELAKARIERGTLILRQARLTAEAAGAETLELAVEADPETAAREAALFQSRRINLQEQVAILEDQVQQKELEFSGLKSRWANTTAERELVKQRLDSLRRLTKQGAASRNDLLDAERSMTQIEGKLSDLSHDIPRTEAALSEITRRRNEAQLKFRSDAEKERGETEVSIAKIDASISALQDRASRSDVTAPIAGVVNKLHVTTIGGVVRGGETLVELVPADSAIAVEARLRPADRADIWPGLPAVIKISAYEFSRFGGLHGKVVDVSPDSLQDEKGNPYFRVRLEATARDLGPNRPVVPGMMADVDILTGRHTVLDYILKPVRGLRDEALRQ